MLKNYIDIYKSYFFAAVLRGSGAALLILFLWVISKKYHAEVVGSFGIIMSLQSIFLIISGLGINESLVRVVAPLYEKKKNLSIK
jgi:O-antigen/teichoic acid export membrane protein